MNLDHLDHPGPTPSPPEMPRCTECGGYGEHFKRCPIDAADTIAAQADQIRELRAALAPFAAIHVPESWDDDRRLYVDERWVSRGQFGAGDVRTAAALVETEEVSP